MLCFKSVKQIEVYVQYAGSFISSNNTELTNFVIIFSNNSCDLYGDLTALGSDLSSSNDTSKL